MGAVSLVEGREGLKGLKDRGVGRGRERVGRGPTIPTRDVETILTTVNGNALVAGLERQGVVRGGRSDQLAGKR